MSKNTKTVAQILKEKFEAFKKKFDKDNPKKFGSNTLEDGTVLSWEGDSLAVDTVVSIGEGEDAVVAPPATYVLTGDMEGTSVIVGEGGVVTEVLDSPEPDETFTKADIDAAVTKAVNAATLETEKKFTAKFAEMNSAFKEMSDLIEKLPSETPEKKKYSAQTDGKTLSFHQQRLIDNLEK